MEKFDIICPDHYPMKCHLSAVDKDHLSTPEKYKAFFIFQYKRQDEWLQPSLEKYFNERTWRLFNAGREGGTGTKWCNICRYALASDFGIVSLSPLNYNVFQEIGFMSGIHKPLIYLYNPNKNEKLPFDIDDQIYIEHTDESSLISGLEKKIPLLIEKLLLFTGFEENQRKLIKEKVENISPEAREILKRIMLEGGFMFLREDLYEWVKNQGMNGKHLSELETQRFIITEIEPGGPKHFFPLKRFNL